MNRRTALLVLSFAAYTLSCQRFQKENLAVLGPMPEVELRNQKGDVVRLSELTRGPLFVAFFFTRCPSVCPRLVERMKAIDAALSDNQNVHFALVSVDAEFDTPEVLRSYAARQALRGERFSLLTGDSHAIANAAEAGFKIGLSGKFAAEEPGLGITHGSHLVLVDAQRQIRKYIRSFDDDAVTQAVLAAGAI
jgi:protein SCO1